MISDSDQSLAESNYVCSSALQTTIRDQLSNMQTQFENNVKWMLQRINEQKSNQPIFSEDRQGKRFTTLRIDQFQHNCLLRLLTRYTKSNTEGMTLKQIITTITKQESIFEGSTFPLVPKIASPSHLQRQSVQKKKSTSSQSNLSQPKPQISLFTPQQKTTKVDILQLPPKIKLFQSQSFYQNFQSNPQLDLQSLSLKDSTFKQQRGDCLLPITLNMDKIQDSLGMLLEESNPMGEFTFQGNLFAEQQSDVMLLSEESKDTGCFGETPKPLTFREPNAFKQSQLKTQRLQAKRKQCTNTEEQQENIYQKLLRKYQEEVA